MQSAPTHVASNAAASGHAGHSQGGGGLSISALLCGDNDIDPLLEELTQAKHLKQLPFDASKGVYFSFFKRVVLRDIDEDFRGLFAEEDIKAGEVIWVNRIELHPQLHETVLDLKGIEALPPGPRDVYKRYAWQVGDDLFSGMISREEAALDAHNFWNHCCDPNVWLCDVDTISARRDIKSGEQLTFDYATTDSYFLCIPKCLCGSKLCRGIVSPYDYLLPELQERYGPHWMPYLRKRIQAARSAAHPRTLKLRAGAEEAEADEETGSQGQGQEVDLSEDKKQQEPEDLVAQSPARSSQAGSPSPSPPSGYWSGSSKRVPAMALPPRRSASTSSPEGGAAISGSRKSVTSEDTDSDDDELSNVSLDSMQSFSRFKSSRAAAGSNADSSDSDDESCDEKTVA